MKFSDVKNRTCLYLLGGIAGLEGSVLNIITTKDDKLFFTNLYLTRNIHERNRKYPK